MFRDISIVIFYPLIIRSLVSIIETWFYLETQMSKKYCIVTKLWGKQEKEWNKTERGERNTGQFSKI